MTNQMLEEEAVGKIGSRPGNSRRGGADQEDSRSEADSALGEEEDVYGDQHEAHSPAKKSRSGGRKASAAAVSTPVKKGGTTRSSRAAESRRDSTVSSIQSSITGDEGSGDDIDVDDDFFNQIGDDLQGEEDDEDYE